MKRLVAMALVGLLLCIGAVQGQQFSAIAQSTAGERAFVYGITAAIPGSTMITGISSFR